MARKLRRYKFQGLKRLGRDQVRVMNALLTHLPQTPFERGFKERLRQVLEPLVHADIDVWFDAIKVIEPGELERALAQPTCCAVVGLAPRDDRALLEVDLVIAQQAIDRLLGGNAEDTDGQRPLTEIEDGVFSFILLKVLQLVQEGYAGERSLSLKLERVCGTWDDISRRVDPQQRFVSVGFKLFFDLQVGFFRLYVPASLVEGDMPVEPPSSGAAADRYLLRLQDRLPIVRLLRAPLSVEVGRLTLPVADLERLEKDDIVLIEKTDCALDQSGEVAVLGGAVQCRVGDGSRGVIQGPVSVGESGRYEVAIESITPTGEPRRLLHLFRDGFGPNDGDAEMHSEGSKALSRSVVDAAAWSARARAGAAARALASGPAPLDPRGVERAQEGEHSGGYDDDAAVEEGGEEPPDADAASLLEDITVAMIVELGRVSVSAADVMGLRPGQVIELARAPGEPVDLVVDGKRIGKGELVEIDGELGVRILSLAK